MPATSDGWDATDGRAYVAWRKTWASNPLLDDESQAALRRVVSPEIRGVEVVEEALPARVKPWLIKNKAVVQESREEEVQSRQRLIDEIDRMFSDDQSDPAPAQPSPGNIVPDSPLMASPSSGPSAKKSAEMANVEVHILSDSDDDAAPKGPTRVRNVPSPADESLLPELKKLKPQNPPPPPPPPQSTASTTEAPPAPSDPPYKAPPQPEPEDTALRWLDTIEANVMPSIMLGLSQYRKVRDKLRRMLLQQVLQKHSASPEAIHAAETMLQTINAAYFACVQDNMIDEAAAMLRDPQLSPIVVDSEAMYDGPEPAPPPVFTHIGGEGNESTARPDGGDHQGTPRPEESTPTRGKRQRGGASDVGPKRRKMKRPSKGGQSATNASSQAARAPEPVSTTSSVNTSPQPAKATSDDVGNANESTAGSVQDPPADPPAEASPAPAGAAPAEATPAEAASAEAASAEAASESAPTAAESTTFCKMHGECSRSSMGGCSACDSALITRLAKRGMMLLRTKNTSRGRSYEVRCAAQGHTDVYNVVPVECWACSRLRRTAEEKARIVDQERRREQAQQKLQQKLFESAQRQTRVNYPEVDPTGSKTIAILLNCAKSKLPSWDILNVRKPQQAAQKAQALNEAKLMYKTLVMRVHPDKCQHPLSQEAFHVLDAAWKTIQKSCQLY